MHLCLCEGGEASAALQEASDNPGRLFEGAEQVQVYRTLRQLQVAMCSQLLRERSCLPSPYRERGWSWWQGKREKTCEVHQCPRSANS